MDPGSKILSFFLKSAQPALQIHDKKDHLNPTDLRMRLQQVSNSNKRQQRETQKIENEQQINEDDKQREEMLKKETSESILDPLNKKIDNIAERLEKDKNDAEANWEKSQRELEEVNILNLHQSLCL